MDLGEDLVLDFGQEDETAGARAPSLRVVRAGFIPLVDCALLAVAAEKGFARRESLRLDLVKEASWANIRDRITLGHLDCAHMLAGIPIASGLDLGNPKARMIAPFSLGLNGNAITVSQRLWAAMSGDGRLSAEAGPMTMAEALARVVTARKAAGAEPLTLGMVYPFSCHNYELRYWMATAGVHPDRDLHLVVIPPPLMVEYLRDGYIDGFCVGEPWNSLAVESGLGRIIVTKAELWRMSPEKVLGVRADWAEANPETLDALLRALYRSAVWAGEPGNRDELAALLAGGDYLDAPKEVIERILSGKMRRAAESAPAEVPDYIVFQRGAATFPWISHAMWIYSQMVRWGQIAYSEDGAAEAARTYRPDLYRRALAGLDVPLPSASAKVEGALEAPTAVGCTSGQLVLGPDGFFDDQSFDPDRLRDYLGSFAIHSMDGAQGHLPDGEE